MTDPIERLTATVKRADAEDPNDIAGNMRAEREADSSAIRILRFLTSDGADEEVADLIYPCAEMDREAAEAVARALLNLIAQKGMGE